MIITMLDNSKLLSAVMASRLLDDTLDLIDTYKVWEKYEQDVQLFNNRELNRHPGHKPELGPKDKQVVAKNGFEHITYTIKIEGISFNLLNKLKLLINTLTHKELRLIYKDIKVENPFCKGDLDGKEYIIRKEDIELAKKYIVLTGNPQIDNRQIVMLESLRQALVAGNTSTEHLQMISLNSIKTTAIITLNAKQIKSFDFTRFEERKFYDMLIEAIPDEHKFLYIGT